MQSRLSRPLLHAIEVYESDHGRGPTAPELAADLGIPAEFGHTDLVERLKRQVSLGRVAHYRGRFTLTMAGRSVLERDAYATSGRRRTTA